MYLYQNQNIVPVKVIEYLKSGNTLDSRIITVEQQVLKAYSLSLDDMSSLDKNSPIKLMIAFMLYDQLNYGLTGIANRYEMYFGFVKHQVTQMYRKCLEDTSYLDQVNAIRQSINQNI